MYSLEYIFVEKTEKNINVCGYHLLLEAMYIRVMQFSYGIFTFSALQTRQCQISVPTVQIKMRRLLLSYLIRIYNVYHFKLSSGGALQ